MMKAEAQKKAKQTAAAQKAARFRHRNGARNTNTAAKAQ